MEHEFNNKYAVTTEEEDEDEEDESKES